MAFQKGKSGNARGRAKGSKNKIGQSAKDAIAQAAEDMGGAKRLLAWVESDPDNEKVFWGTIYPKLLPHQITGDKDNPVQVKQVVEHTFKSAI